MNGFNFKVNASVVEDVALNIEQVLKATMSAEIDAFEANQRLYHIYANNAVESALVYSSDEQSLKSVQTTSNDTYQIINEIGQHSERFATKITPQIFNQVKVKLYIEQLRAINKTFLAADPNLFADEKTLVDDFMQYQLLIGPLERTLGFNDYSYSADFDRSDFWPSAEYNQGAYKYINLFRGSKDEKVKSAIFSDAFNALSPREKYAAFAWVYNANFEEYLSVGALPNELPPWIDSQALSQMHKHINSAVMQKYEEKESDMLEM